MATSDRHREQGSGKLAAQLELIVGPKGIPGAAAYPPDWRELGRFDYVYREGHILIRDMDVARVSEIVFGRVVRPESPRRSTVRGRTEGEGEIGDETRLRGLSLYLIEDERRTYQGHLDAIDSDLGVGVATPDHLLYMVPAVSHCPATEPESVREDAVPVPEPLPDKHSEGILVHILDSGWLVGADGEHHWLHGVDGDPEDPYFPGTTEIQSYAGHGTFCAGVLRTVAPGADVYVEKTFYKSGGVFESDVVAQAQRALSKGADILSLSAGTHTRKDIPLIGFDVVEKLVQSYKGVVLVAAAGNDSSREPFWPAASPWTVSVGALSANWKERAWFSNYGGWVDVFAPGEDLVNAYATGTFTCIEDPNVGQVRTFQGMARWSGTSFSTPLVAGLIAARMAATGENGREAADALLRHAHRHAQPGVGAVLLPGHEHGPTEDHGHCGCGHPGDGHPGGGHHGGHHHPHGRSHSGC
jgi:Subtilase family